MDGKQSGEELTNSHLRVAEECRPEAGLCAQEWLKAEIDKAECQAYQSIWKPWSTSSTFTPALHSTIAV
jgi:hypothetical protein